MTDPTAEPDAPDPLALRALAHPIRWKLIDVLTTEGTVTATRCAELIGESTATCSYHLGVLAKYGYITRVAGTQWREKPWRLVNPDLNLSSSGLDDEQAAASRAAAAAFVDFEMTRLKDSLHRSAPEGWQDAHKIMATTAWLDAAELSQAIAEMRRVLDTYADRGRVPAERRKGARPARLFAAVTLMPSAGPDD
jgi:hypothetical protein